MVFNANHADGGQRHSRNHPLIVPRPPGLTPERVSSGPLSSYRMAPERVADARPVSVYLHGICGDPSNGCPYFRAGDHDTSWLACPSAPVRCPEGGATWTTSQGAQRLTIERAIGDIAARDPQHVDTRIPGVLIGFSQGAYVARNLLRPLRGHFRAVVFVGANIRVDAAELRAAGIARVVFAAGRFDGSRAILMQTTARLVREHFPARFVDLGAVGHTYVPEGGAALWREALAWVQADG